MKVKDGRFTKHQKFKKWKCVPPSSTTDFFGVGTNYSKQRSAQIRFIKDLVLHVCKGYKNISIVESSWFRRLVMKRDPKVEFLTFRQFVLEYLPNMVAKTMDRYVLLLLAKVKLQMSFLIFGCP